MNFALLVMSYYVPVAHIYLCLRANGIKEEEFFFFRVDTMIFCKGSSEMSLEFVHYGCDVGCTENKQQTR